MGCRAVAVLGAADAEMYWFGRCPLRIVTVPCGLDVPGDLTGLLEARGTFCTPRLSMFAYFASVATDGHAPPSPSWFAMPSRMTLSVPLDGEWCRTIAMASTLMRGINSLDAGVTWPADVRYGRTQSFRECRYHS